MSTSNSFRLIGHLQVMEEPLSSVYTDSMTGITYLFVRLFENIEDSSYILSQVAPRQIIDYMNRKVGLKTLFESNPSFYYKNDGSELSTSAFQTLTKNSVDEKLNMDGLDDMYDSHLAYRSAVLKQYLLQQANK